MTKYSDIQNILEEAIQNSPSIGAHGTFWRNISRDEFVSKKVFGCQIIVRHGETFVGAESPLVKILRAPIVCEENDFPQMPAGGFDPLPEVKIQTISDWIDAQCPE